MEPTVCSMGSWLCAEHKAPSRQAPMGCVCGLLAVGSVVGRQLVHPPAGTHGCFLRSVDKPAQYAATFLGTSHTRDGKLYSEVEFQF